MVSPIDPEMCITTGRMLTEWFEYPEYTDDQLFEMGAAKYGTTVEDMPRGDFMKMSPDGADLQRKINAFVAGKKRRKWRNGMSQQEIQYRMNEATKMISPDNYKFLDDATRERTGLEVNPLWMMECLVRSGVLSPKEQVAALTNLAGYTHSKAATISHATHEIQKPEDWLLELAKDEYQVLGVDVPIKQPYQPIERGAGKTHDSRMGKRVAETRALESFNQDELAELEAMVDAEFEDIDE